MRRSFWLLFGVVLLISGLAFLSGCPKSQTEEGTGIERPGGEQVQPGTPATTGGAGTQGAPAQAPSGESAEEQKAPSGEQGATAPGGEGAGGEEAGKDTGNKAGEEKGQDTGNDTEKGADENAEGGA